jgi:hypothetical protein
MLRQQQPAPKNSFHERLQTDRRVRASWMQNSSFVFSEIMLSMRILPRQEQLC